MMTQVRRSQWLRGTVVLTGLLPLGMGACPRFQNSVIDSLTTASVTLVTQDDPDAAGEQARDGVLAAIVESLFNRWRADEEP
ncbi:hypothetical protein RAS1_12260 [Phycisphaerae bacterium RAS1]|nr:hypothetical protein RAS1_12260 [Phycisphaerae bacterium RAS1]